MSSARKIINNEDLLALKSYVTAKDDTWTKEQLHKDTIVIDLTHSNLKQKHLEIRFDLHDTIQTLKDKIYQKTGTPSSHQHLQFRNHQQNNGNQIMFEIYPEESSSINNRMLGYYSLPQYGIEVHCIDTNPNSISSRGQLEDVSLVEKYQISEENYNQRHNTLRSWTKQQQAKDSTFTLAKHARQHRELMDAQRQYKLGLQLPKGFAYDKIQKKVVRVEADDEDENDDDNNNNASADNKIDGAVSEAAPGIETVKDIEVGMRCEVSPGGRRGRVEFVGCIDELGTGGYWVGIVFDEPVGKTDGSIGTNSNNNKSIPNTSDSDKKRYFTCLPNYGSFVRGYNIKVGDFPERDIFDELDDSDTEDEL